MGSAEELLLKLQENNARREGEHWDPFNRAFGKSKMPHDEVLLTYKDDAIIGIEISHSSYLPEALVLRKKLQAKTKKTIGIYQYKRSQGELTRIPESLINELTKNKTEVKLTTKSPYPPLPVHYKKEIIKSKEVTCSIENNAPSPEHPVEYRVLVKRKKLECKAFFENKTPVIRVNGTIFRDKNNLLPELAFIHQAHLVETCNTLLSNRRLAERLGIRFISLRLIDPDTKPQLILSYRPLTRHPCDHKKLLQLMGYNADHVKLTEMKYGKIQAHLPVLQALDPMVKQLTSLTSSLEENAHKKTRIC